MGRGRVASKTLGVLKTPIENRPGVQTLDRAVVLGKDMLIGSPSGKKSMECYFRIALVVSFAVI